MKAIISSGTNIFKGQVLRIIVESDQLKLIFDSKATITFESKDYDPNTFPIFMNTMKNININAPGVFHINVNRGTIQNFNTEKSNKEFNSFYNSTPQTNTTTTKPATGVFTQEAQGATSKLNQEVLNKLESEFKSRKQAQSV